MHHHFLTLIHGAGPLCTIQRLKPMCDTLLSSCAFSFNLRRYTTGAPGAAPVVPAQMMLPPLCAAAAAGGGEEEEDAGGEGEDGAAAGAYTSPLLSSTEAVLVSEPFCDES